MGDIRAGWWNGGRAAAAALPFVFGSAAPAPDAAAVRGLCTAREQVLFSCGAGSRIISVCANGGAVQYRFGRSGRVELTYPVRGKNGHLYHAYTGYSGGGEEQIGFERAGLHYVTYSRMVRTGFTTTNNPRFEAGVAVRRGEHTIADQRCTAPSDAGIDGQAAARILPEGEFIYIN